MPPRLVASVLLLFAIACDSDPDAGAGADAAANPGADAAANPGADAAANPGAYDDISADPVGARALADDPVAYVTATIMHAVIEVAAAGGQLDVGDELRVPDSTDDLDQSYTELARQIAALDRAALIRAAARVVERWQRGDDNMSEHTIARALAITEWGPSPAAVAHDDEHNRAAAAEPDEHDGGRCVDTSAPDGDRYSICIDEQTWEQAAASCRARGQTLASIHDEETSWHLSRALREQLGDRRAWLGLRDRAGQELFTWEDGSRLDFTYFAPHAPIRLGDRFDCVAAADWGWLDLPCHDRAAFVCRSAE